ncbi:MAG TPA: RagB/SusD family nutrient uptake outer membrane protein [Chitinophaga sp.]|uniref:RagB/SusD family nutrient uptake outer membrane protein n=1 Tax=Chitinophaga sp. TaxID=1869181 RepID=UPI002DBC295E|nr:RagB/SusD family nutrient uptake outer membrane protein [Chitinophaga sp.]HEU4554535.1 RagB/SusD family nutrient uptake outer membrane protein [Chitinophaga sp.]
MKKQLIILSIFISAFGGLIGCTSLDVTPLNQFTSASVWKDATLMQAYVTNIYTFIGYGEFNSTSGLSVLDDEAMWTNGATPIVQSTITSSNLDILGGSRFNYLLWDNLYSGIRQCNDFLENSASSPVAGQPMVQRMRGEAYFLRGYLYHNLMRVNGGIPLITKVYGLKDSTAIARNTFEETVNFIVRDADSAAALLPTVYTGADVGRATKGAALALKSRVLLYAASDLYNINPSHMPETGYTGGDRQARWTAARDAAKAVMDLGIYKLFAADPAPGDSTAANYANLFLSKTNEEVIFSRFTSVNAGAPNVGLWFNPNGYHGYGENSPIQQMVDAYEMKDGSKFSWGNPVHAAHPYENRDPRFYATVFYDGAHWKKRTSDGEVFDPVGIIQAFKTLKLPDGSTLPGIDTRNGPIENWNGSYPNYYLRKFVDPNNDHRSVAQEIPWPFFRYAEILLNYAEACIELTQYQDARDALNQIRRRAGMPEFTAALTGVPLRDEYRNERRIELAFEEHRFFDIRRWMIAPQVMNENAKGIEISVQGTNRADRSTYHDYSYKVIDVQTRHWDDKMYFIPIQFAEMNRNPLLKQNPGF